MVSKSRASRIADRILQDLSIILLTESKDPRLAGISITDVRVDRELAFADIYISSIEGSERSQEVLEGLAHAQGYLRTELARRVDLRTFPRLRFHWDPTYERADTMDKLIASLHEPDMDEHPVVNQNDYNEGSK